MTVTFEFCALHYLDVWFSSNKDDHNLLNMKDNDDQKLEVIKKVATRNRVGRNLKKVYDINANPPMKRYEPVLQIIEQKKYQNINKSNRIIIINEIKDKIHDHYKKYVLSFVTKILWIKHRNSKIIIYDSYVREALKTEGLSGDRNNIEKYIATWEECYNKYSKKIDDAVTKLIEVKIYSKSAFNKNDTEIINISQKKWFKNRVFDHYLWNIGKSIKKNQKMI